MAKLSWHSLERVERCPVAGETRQRRVSGFPRTASQWLLVCPVLFRFFRLDDHPVQAAETRLEMGGSCGILR